MECIVANVDNMQFDIETALDEQYGALPLPFTGMDSTRYYYLLIQCIQDYVLTSYSTITYLFTISASIYTQQACILYETTIIFQSQQFSLFPTSRIDCCSVSVLSERHLR